MKAVFLHRSFLTALLVAVACVSASARALVPFYKTSSQAWEGKYFAAPVSDIGAPDNWNAENFDDSSWSTISGPLLLSNGTWQANYYSYWVRCYFDLDELNSAKNYTFYAQHDDGCKAYLNGVEIYNNTAVADYSTTVLSAEAKAALKVGRNVLCVFVSDTGGGDAFMDFGLYEDDPSNIVSRSDVQLSMLNDETYPWTVEGLTVKNGNCGKGNSISTLTMTYRSEFRTELSFDWRCYNYSSHTLSLLIDDVQKNSTTNSSYNTVRLFLEPGEHVIVFKDVISSSSTTTSNYSYIKNVVVKEITPLEDVVLTENSQPITFVNNDVYPWTIENGYIQNSNYGTANSSSSFSTTFTVNETSKFSFDRRVSRSDNSYNYEDRHQLYFKVNGITIYRAWNLTDFGNYVMCLEPGTYTVEWKDTVFNYTNWYYSQIKNIELSSNWQTVELSTAGTLGYEVLSLPAFNVLTDVEFLKVKGPLNAADWTDIKNMTNLLALDLSEAVIGEIPNNAFDGKSMINSVILPEGITRIGEYAFQGTNIRRINIPASVKTIGKNAFVSTPLLYVSFANDSQLETIGRYAFQNLASLQSVDFGNMTKLKSIGYAAFADCGQLKEFIMPNSVTDLGYYQFHNNTSMTKLHLSDALSSVPDLICRNCTSLKDIHIPVNAGSICRNAFENCTALRKIDIPETVNIIQLQAFYNCGLDSIKLPVQLTGLGHQCFQNCQNLKYAEMPSYISTDTYSYIGSYNYWGEDSHRWYDTSYGWDNTFQGCPSIEKIVMRSATPPSVRNDIVNGARAKSAITLVVPSFSVVNYKLDTYWYQFGNIIEGDDVDYWKITSPLMLTNNRRMQGKPDVDLYYGGQLTVGGNAPFTMGQFNMYVSETNPSRLLTTCEAMSADAMTTRFSVNANTWYFFTPLHDVKLADISVSNSASYVFRYYDGENRATNGASGSWKNVDTDKLLAGQGYIFHCNTACVITMPADAAGQAQLFATADVTMPLSVHEATTTANRSWNYVGNPYPAYYDIYYMDFTAPITVWTGSTYKAYSIADDDLVLRPMQAFFVQKPDAVDAIKFRKEGRQLAATVNRASARSLVAGQGKRYVYNLQIEGQGHSDETRVVISSEATADYDLGSDAAKFMSIDQRVPQLFTVGSEGTAYAINERPIDGGQVKLAYYAGQEGFYTISAQRADGGIMLYDAQQEKTIDISTQGYTFYTEATSSPNLSRFTLKLDAGSGATTGIETVGGAGEAYDVYDLQGRKVSTAKKGVYIKRSADGRLQGKNGLKVVSQ